MRLCKQVDFIQGTDIQDLKEKLNKALLNGAELGCIDIASLTGAIVVTEYVGDIKKTLLDELEDELGRHSCEECPFFVESTDRRKKWHECAKHGKGVKKTSSCCVDYYREEGMCEKRIQVHSTQDRGEAQRVRLEEGRFSGMAQGVNGHDSSKDDWANKMPMGGMRIGFKISERTNGRIV